MTNPPFRIPIDVTTRLPIDEAMEELLDATEPRGFSIMAHRRLTGTVSRDRIVLRRGTIPGWSLSRSYGEFRGRLVEEDGRVRLRGEFVEVEATPNRSEIVALLVVLAMALALLIERLTAGAPFDVPMLGFGVAIFLVLLLGPASRRRPGPGERHQNVSASAELLSEELARILKG